MPNVIVRLPARIDIAEIWEYIADDSETQADTFVDRMDTKFKLLADQPDLGRQREDLATRLRSFPFERYIIFYRAIKDGIEVLRVLHSARDVETLFHARK